MDQVVTGTNLRQDQLRPGRVSVVLGGVTVVLALASALLTFLVVGRTMMRGRAAG